jgi:DNA replication protein DnaC
MSNDPQSFPFVGLDIPAPSTPVDLDARAEAFHADAILRTRREYFKNRAPVAYQEPFDLQRVAKSKPGAARAYDNTAALEKVLAWKRNPVGLLLSGPQGRGKTRAAYALCSRLLCDEGVNVALWQASAFFAELQGYVRYGNDEASGFIERQAARPVFFLDDFGQQALLRSREEWAQAWFFRFLDLRLGARLPLILTTNQTAEQIAGRDYDSKGDPLVRRLIDLAEPVKFL